MILQEMNRMELMFFIIVTLVFVFMTWFVSLRGNRVHGFFRFFSFESILLLVILVHEEWFSSPFSWYQIFSWLFLAGTFVIALFGFSRFYGSGKPADGMEQTIKLIDSGLFAHIRHPLYLSLLLGGLGIMWKHPGWPEVLLSCVNILALYITAKVEEKEMLASFGDAYAAYMKKPRMFIPYLW